MHRLPFSKVKLFLLILLLLLLPAIVLAQGNRQNQARRR